MANEEGEEKINFDAEEKIAQQDDKMEEMGIDDLEARYVKHPGVGETLTLDMVKVFKDRNVTARNKQGEAFSTALSSVDYKITIETKEGKLYSPPSWEVWGKVRALILEKSKKLAEQFVKEGSTKEIAEEKAKKQAMKLKIEILHKVDGSLATRKVEEVAKLRDISVDEAQKLIKLAAEAKKNKQLYDIKEVQ